MTSTQREARIVDSPAKTGITREAIVTKVIDQPVLDTVIEKKNVEVHHVPIVKEIHEQKIIEIEKPKQTTFVLEKAREESYVAPKIVEEINRGGFTEQERLKLASMQEVKAPLVEKMASVETIKEGEQIQSVIYQPTIERHVIPQITEIREQKVIEVVEQPITRRIIEKPIIREVGAASNVYLDIDNMPLRSMAYSYDNIPSDVLNLSYTPSGKMRSQSSMLKKRSYKLGFSNSSRIGMISAPSQSWKKDRLEIQRRYRLYNPSINSFKFNESGQRTALQSAYDQFRSRQGYQKYRRYYYPFGKTRSTDSLKKNDPYMEYPTLLLDAWKKPEDPMLQGAFESEEETIERGPLRSIAHNIKETVVDTFNKLF